MIYPIDIEQPAAARVPEWQIERLALLRICRCFCELSRHLNGDNSAESQFSVTGFGRDLGTTQKTFVRTGRDNAYHGYAFGDTLPSITHLIARRT
jgi:hypothetical protein